MRASPSRQLRTDLQDTEIQLSQAVCQLSGGVRTELQGKLRDVLDRLGREVVEDPESKSELPDRAEGQGAEQPAPTEYSAGC
jgi:hypothetical protein